MYQVSQPAGEPDARIVAFLEARGLTENAELRGREQIDYEQLYEEIRLRSEEEERQREHQRRIRYVQHTGRPGRPREKRQYHHDGSRRAKLKPGEAYCCRCRVARPYRYPRRAELVTLYGPAREQEMLRIAIRARCSVCHAQVFRIVRPEEADGLQVFHPGFGPR